MAHYNFDKDLEDGLKAEDEVKELLKKHFNVQEPDIEKSAIKDYDIKIVSKNLTFEVKNDLMAEKTGNVAVEYESRKKATGISVTKADYWVYKFAGVFYMIETNRLKKELLENKNYWRSGVNGGDLGSNTMMFLVKVNEFKTWGIQL
jgi:hypothetical protein